MLNKVQLIGNLGSDPELRSTKNGTPVCNISMATSRVWYDNNKEKQEETEWHKVIIWGKQAESVSRFMSKGSKMYVEGRIQTRKWEDDEGNNRYSTEIVAERTLFLDSRGASGGSSGGGSEKSNSTTPPIDDDDLPF